MPLALCCGRSALADGPCSHLNVCHPQAVSAYSSGKGVRVLDSDEPPVDDRERDCLARVTFPPRHYAAATATSDTRKTHGNPIPGRLADNAASGRDAGSGGRGGGEAVAEDGGDVEQNLPSSDPPSRREDGAPHQGSGRAPPPNALAGRRRSHRAEGIS